MLVNYAHKQGITGISKQRAENAAFLRQKCAWHFPAWVNKTELGQRDIGPMVEE